MAERALLVTSGFLVDRLAGLQIEAEVVGPAALKAGLPANTRERIEAIACFGELSGDLIDALPNLRLVACFSTGYEGIDLAHLRARGIALTTGGGVNAHDVADHAIALFLALWHDVCGHDRLVRSGGWRQDVRPRASLRGRRAGVVGFGRIGQAIAARAAAHDMAVAWWGPNPKPDAAYPRAESLLALAEASDVLFVTSRSTPDNVGEIDAEVLRALGSDGFLINIARGALVDEPALIEALRSRTIRGAGLDVFVTEPADLALWHNVPGLVLSPHVAGFTVDGGQALDALLRANIEHHFSGKPLLSEVSNRG